MCVAPAYRANPLFHLSFLSCVLSHVQAIRACDPYRISCVAPAYRANPLFHLSFLSFVLSHVQAIRACDPTEYPLVGCTPSRQAAWFFGCLLDTELASGAHLRQPNFLSYTGPSNALGLRPSRLYLFLPILGLKARPEVQGVRL
jgi:hypothetical protein